LGYLSPRQFEEKLMSNQSASNPELLARCARQIVSVCPKAKTRKEEKHRNHQSTH
jgi:hypothetical protein